MICPCCGSPMPEDATLAAFIARQGPVKQRVLRALVAATEPLSGDRLADRVYAGDIGGGPDYARKVMQVHISAVRPKLAQIGWVIRSHGWGGYLLERAA